MNSIQSFIDRMEQKQASEDISNVCANQKQEEVRKEISEIINEIKR